MIAMTSLTSRACALLLSSICAALSSPAWSATPSGATYAMPVSVLNAGEGDMSSASYRLRGSLGEPVAGVTSSGTSYMLSSGFVSAVFVPIVQVTPAKLDFASQTAGLASAAQSLQITNLGAAPLSLSGVTVNGDFAQTNTCTAVVQGGAGCTLSVTFNPTAAGARTGTLSFASNAPGSPTQIALTGTGVAAAATAPPPPVATTPAPASPPIASASTGAGPLCVPPVPPAKTSAPAALTLDITARDTVAKGRTCIYSAAVATGQTYVMSLVRTVGQAALKVFYDAALKQPMTCLAPNLANSTLWQPADCSFVATGSMVYASVSGTSYQALAQNSYNIRISPRFDAAPAIQGSETNPVPIPINQPYGGTAGPAWSDYSYYMVDTTGSTGDVVFSLTGQTSIQSAYQALDLFIYDNPQFKGALDSSNCYLGELKTFAESCVLPAGKIYYLKVKTGQAGGPFTLMIDTGKP
jgi:hypothetical protein